MPINTLMVVHMFSGSLGKISLYHIRQAFGFAFLVVMFKNQPIGVCLMGTNKVTRIAGDAFLKDKRSACIPVDKRLYFLPGIGFRKLKHRAALKTYSAAIAQILSEKKGNLIPIPLIPLSFLVRNVVSHCN
ncbi:MAG: hypothetical protein R2861_15490 [Desulfobacterales bacterium]